MAWPSANFLLSLSLINTFLLSTARHSLNDAAKDPSLSKNILLDHEAIKQLSQVFEFPTAVLSRNTRAGDTNVYHYNSGYALPNDTVFLPFEADNKPDALGNGDTIGKRISDADHQLGSYVRPAEDSTYATHVPAYMINLYNTVADSNGVMRIPNPFQANLIKSFAHKKLKDDIGIRNEQLLRFNLSSLTGKETLLQAELHIRFGLRFPNATSRSEIGSQPVDSANLWDTLTKPFKPSPDKQSNLIKKVTLHLHQVKPMPGAGESYSVPVTSKTVFVVAVPGELAYFTQIFAVKSVVLDWIQSQELQNAGLRIAISCADAVSDNQEECDWEKSSDPNTQPSLVLFMDDGRPPSNRNPKYRIKGMEKQTRFVRALSDRFGDNHVEESYKGGSDDEKDSENVHETHKTAFLQRFRRSDTQPNTRPKKKPGFVRKIKKYIKTKDNQNPKSTMSYKPRIKAPQGPCKRHDLHVSFEDIGWSSWIISPKTFQAYYCRGDCRFPIGQESKPSNHATIISIVHHMRFNKRVGAPCCVPDKLYSISLLYFDSEQNVILKQYDDMVAQSCACR